MEENDWQGFFIFNIKISKINHVSILDYNDKFISILQIFV